jgi:hypothetical protein
MAVRRNNAPWETLPVYGDFNDTLDAFDPCAGLAKVGARSADHDSEGGPTAHLPDVTRFASRYRVTNGNALAGS